MSIVLNVWGEKAIKSTKQNHHNSFFILSNDNLVEAAV